MGITFDAEFLKDIKDCLDEEEGIRPYEIALEASSPGPCLETGGYCGMSSLYLGTVCRENKGILFTADSY